MAIPRSADFLLLLAACPLAFGQTAAVQGVVTNAVTGEPLLRAHVVLQPTPSTGQAKKYGGLTTVEGKFAIAGVVPGRYRIEVDKVGFVTMNDAPALNLQAADMGSDLKLTLMPTGAITGRVFDSEGEPAEGVVVQVEHGPYGGGGSTKTGDGGQYRIGGLGPGRYRVRANEQETMLPPEIRTDGTKEMHYGTVFYPGVRTAKSAARVEVQGGRDTAGIDIRLVRTPIVRVSGVISGLPPGTRNVLVQARQSRSEAAMALAKSDGTFEIWRLNPGKYTIAATWTGTSGVQANSTLAEIDLAESNIDRITLNAVAPMEIAGRVLFEEDAARPPKKKEPQPLQINFASLEGFSSQTAEFGADDSFHIGNLFPGRYRVSLTWDAYVKSMRLESAPVEGEVLDLRNGVAGTTLTLTASSAMGELSGTVSNEKGPAAAVVALVPEDWDGTGQVFQSTEAKSDGAYRFDRIVPGRYRVMAIDESLRALQMRAANLEESPEDADSVEVRAGEKVTKDLTRRKP